MKNLQSFTLKKFVFVLFLLFLSSQFIMAQTGTVKGTIYDDGGTAIPGVYVSLEGTSLGVVSSTSGTYLLKNVPVGTYTIKAALKGFMTAEKSVIVADGKTVEISFALKSGIYESHEIMVTATRRSTDVQETPAAITAVSGEKLESKGVVNVTDFIDEVPGVTMSDSGGTFRVIMRSIATSTQSIGSATVASYFDDFALPSFATKIRLVDMDRIEVLKGPQGTLFGRSAMGGIIRYISNKPNTDGFAGGFNSYISNTTDGGMNYGGHGYANVPITKNLALRVVGYTYQNSGFIDNIELNEPDFNGEDTLGGRLALHWDATDKLSLDLTYFNQSSKHSTANVTTTRDPGDLNIAGDEGPDIPFDVKGRESIGGYSTRFDVDLEYLNIKLEYDFNAFTATLLGTKGTHTDQFRYDQREYVSVSYGSLYDVQDNEIKSNLLELRLVSSGDDNLIDWILGAYYEDTETNGTQFINYKGPSGGLLFGFFPLYEGMPAAIDQAWIHNGTEKAIYGELGLNFSKNSRILIGYRRSDVSYDQLSKKADGFFDLWQGDAAVVDKLFATQEDVNTYKVSLEHNFSLDIFGYALASSGYRRGGYNRPTAISPFSTYDSDKLWNYELGLKTIWLNGRMRANIAAYLIKYTDIQLMVQDPVTFVRATKNVGKANITGIEFDIHYMPIDNLIFGFAGSLSNPKLMEDIPPSDDGFGNLTYTGRKGDKLPGSATESFSFSVNYEKSFNDKLKAFANVAFKYVGKRLNDFNLELDDFVLPAYSMANVRVGVSLKSGLTVTLFADNLFDEAAIYYINRSTGRFNQVPTNRPRTVGLNLSYNFR
ncbi:MAG: TonB-dependent receptor [Acidobacteriota bacterium]